MKLGRVIGSIWSTCKNPRLVGRRMLIVTPISSTGQPTGAEVIALDTMDAGSGDVVMYATASEAALPFKPGLTPTDATIVGIVERVDRSESTWHTA